MSLASINRKARIGAVSAASAVGLLAALVNVGVARAQNAAPMQTAPLAHACGHDQAGLTLPAGFCATIFADNIGHARQLVVAPNGVVYVNTWSGRYYHNDVVPPTGFLVALKDSKGTGVADIQQRFGETLATGGHGGTGIALYDGFLYAESNDRIVRYALGADSLQPRGAAEVIVSGLPLSGDHPMHPFMIDRDAKLYIDVASATNACQSKNRTPKSPGIEPCAELKTRGGIWRYDARKTQQVFSPAGRYATGIRNAEGIALDSSGHAIYATQHGRDQLRNNWPELYQPEQEATLPAEEVVSLREGGDYGWPECYFDAGQRKLVLAPEYGGDGGKALGVCASKLAPVAYFPAHWAPNALLFYSADQFPARYRGGAFIAFHGSWDRAPYAQGGYNVVFQPLSDGKASGPCEIFADGFAGPVVVSGWSAGAQLAALHLGHRLVAAGLAISGVYDLRPLRDTALNDVLKLTDAEVAALSPVRSPPASLKPLAIAYGTHELPALVHDSRKLHALRSAAHAPGPLLPIAGADHFSILEQLRRPNGQLVRAAQRLIEDVSH